MRLRENDVEQCQFCGWQIYNLQVTGLWYDMVHHEFHCLDNPPTNLHIPKEDRRKRNYEGTDYA